ncbi:hypothetical protein [Kitasatospora cinereorecta]|uniref:Lipoprotein n=1 Tax=Kitasatospora cinereorecta TaxID=285560 RepID=A0ABW0V5G2_9ACTN
MRTLRIASAVAVSALLVGGLTACNGKSGSGQDAKAGASAAASAGASGAANGASAGAGAAAGKDLAPKEALLASAAVMDKLGSAKLTTKGATADDSGTGAIVWKAPQAFQITTKNEGKDYQVLFTGDVMYVGATPELASVAGGKKWMKIDLKAAAASGAPGTEDAGSFAAMTQLMNPAVQLAVAAPNATKVGAEKVDGVDTVHYRSQVDVDALVAGMTLAPDMKAKVTEQLKKDGTKTTFDLWINAKGELVQQAGTELGAGGAGATTVKYSELGTVTAPKAPAASDVFDLADLMKQLGQH